MTHSPIFIVGCPRSGKTLLRDLLRSHPHLTFPSESHFAVDFYQAYGDPRNEDEARRLAGKLLKLRSVRSLDLQLEPSAFANDRSCREVMSRIYEAWALKQNKPRWGNESPRHVRNLPALLEIFPAAKIIHVYRDGRDVALDWLKHLFGPHNLFTAARGWKTLVSAGRQAGAKLPPETYLEVGYESLVGDPVTTMKRVCAFLDEPFTEAVLRPNRSVRRRRGSPAAHRLIFGRQEFETLPSEIVPGNAGTWKRAMPASDRILFESVAGDLLDALGYETEGVTRRITMPERFLWRAHNLLGWFLRRLNTTGKRQLLRDSLSQKWRAFCYRRRARARR